MSALAGSGERRAFLRFDLTPLAGLTANDVRSATLRLFVSNIQDAGDIDLHTVTQSWDEGIIASGNQPNIDPVFESVTISLTDRFRYVTVDVTQQIKDWLGAVANNGIAIIPNALDGLRLELDSKENTGTAHPAEIEVTLTTPNISNYFIEDLECTFPGGGTTNACTVICPNGKSLLGGGLGSDINDCLGLAEGQLGTQVCVRRVVYGVPDLNKVSVELYNGSAQAQNVTARAFCADVSP